MKNIDFNIEVSYYPEWKILFLYSDGLDSERIENVEEEELYRYVGDYAKILLTKNK